MKKFVFPFRMSCALALSACLAATPALHAQQPTSAGRHSAPTVAAARPLSTPAITVAPGTGEEENEPSPPLDLPPGTPETTETVILATDGATFASKDRIAVFMGNVKVTDPRFQLSCDKLTVFLNKSPNTDATGAAATPAPVSTPPPLAKGTAPEPAPTPANSGGIDHAIAEGHVVIVQERAATAGAEAKRSVGRGDWANFDNKTGDMVLKGMPSVEQNENTHVATSPNTVMTLRKDNSLTTIGPSKTTIIQRKGTQLPGSDNPSPAPGQPGQTAARPGQPTATPGGRRTRGPAPSPSPAAGGVRG
jgi:lipopolysaccharide export system protein LptA